MRSDVENIETVEMNAVELLTPEQLTEIAAKVRVLERTGILSATVEIGGLLQSAFERAGHHGYLAWIRSEFGWSERSAANYRNAYQFAQALQAGQYGKKCQLAALNISLTAIYVLMERATDEVIKDVIKRARKSRVVRAIVIEMIAESRAKTAAEPIADDDEFLTPDLEDAPSSVEDVEASYDPPASADDDITAALICLHASADDELVEASRVLDSSKLRRIIEQLEAAYQQRFGDRPHIAAADRAEARSKKLH